MCKVKGCSRPVFAEGRCGFHALQGYYASLASHGSTVPWRDRMLGEVFFFLLGLASWLSNAVFTVRLATPASYCD